MTDRSSSYDRMPLALAAVLAGFLAAGVAASRFAPAADAPVVGLPDLSNAHLVEVRDASGRTILTGEFRERIDPLGNVDRDAALVDRRGRRVIGEIDIEIPGPNSMTNPQQLEIDIIELEPNATHSLWVDDREVATFTTDDRGSIDMQIHSPVSRGS